MHTQKSENIFGNLRNYYDLLYLFPKRIPWRIKKSNRQLRSILRKRNIKAPMRVLDLGCGAGKNTMYLKNRGFYVVGIDFSQQALKLAKQAKIKSPLILVDAFRLPFKKHTFDLVIDVGCFHCLPPFKQDRTRDEILRILTPKGLYFLRLWYSDQTTPKILLPLFYLNEVPIWGFNSALVKTIFFKKI